MKKLNLLIGFILMAIFFIAASCNDQSFEITEGGIDMDYEDKPEILSGKSSGNTYVVYLIEYNIGTTELRKQAIRELFKKHPYIRLRLTTNCEKYPDKELWHIELYNPCDSRANCSFKEPDPKVTIESTEVISRVIASNNCND